MDRMISTELMEEDIAVEGSLRPQNLSEYIGLPEIELEADSRIDDGDLIHLGNLEFKVIHTPFSFLTPLILCFKTSSINTARSSLVCPSGTSSKYINIVTKGACPLHVINVISWY